MTRPNDAKTKAAEADTVLTDERADALRRVFDETPYNRLLGIAVETVQLDFARLQMPFKDDLKQPRGVLHGGALASAIDSAAALAVLSGLEERPKKVVTLDFHMQYLGAVFGEDIVVEARVRRRGRKIVFITADARTTGGKPVAHGELSFFVEP